MMGGGDEGRATREEASKDMLRGTHLTAVYPALFDHQLSSFHREEDASIFRSST